MARMSPFNSPLLLGFDDLERVLEHVSKHPGEGYPPYNIEQTGDHALRISLAVAGFAIGDLTVQVEGNQLLVRGRRREDEAQRVYLHRGIAARQFQRAFVLAEGIEVTGATLESGLLHIDLARPVAQPSVKTIAIGKAGRDATIPANQSRVIDVLPE